MRQDASNRAQDEVVDLLQEALQAYPPQAHPFRSDIPEYELPLGGYLLTLGYATPRQIIVALRGQRRRAEQGSLVQLGEILIEQGVIQRLRTWPWQTQTISGVGAALLLPLTIWIIQRLLQRLGI